MFGEETFMSLQRALCALAENPLKQRIIVECILWRLESGKGGQAGEKITEKGCELRTTFSTESGVMKQVLRNKLDHAEKSPQDVPSL